jgi:hypothetical protein
MKTKYRNLASFVLFFLISDDWKPPNSPLFSNFHLIFSFMAKKNGANLLNRYGSSFLALMICLIVISPSSEASDLQCISLVQIRWPQLPEYLQTGTGRLFWPNWGRKVSMKTVQQGENRGPNGFSCLNLNRMAVSPQFFICLLCAFTSA